MFVRLVGVENAVKIITERGKRMKGVANKTTAEWAKSFAGRVRSKLSQKTSYQGQGHNTPISLRRSLKVQKTPTGHNVSFVGAGNLPLIVEEGTKQHVQPNNRIIQLKGIPGTSGIHPGAKGKHFWSNAMDEWSSADIKRIAFKSFNEWNR